MRIQLNMQSQPDDCTCGPTCLHAVYQYFKRNEPLESVISSVQDLTDGGTLAVFLGIDALKKGFKATIFSYNLHLFDPSWNSLNSLELKQKLIAQKAVKSDSKLQLASDAYIEFLRLGGIVRFDNLDKALLKHYLIDLKLPVLTGLSATYLYQSKREFTEGHVIHYEDVKGEPMGHFVVLTGMEGKTIYVADPYLENPSQAHHYKVSVSRLLNSILLGIVTYDANLLIIQEK